MRVQINLIRGKVTPFKLKRARRILSAFLILAFLLGGMGMLYTYIDDYYEIKEHQNQLQLISHKFNFLNEEVFRIMEYKEEWDYLEHKITLAGELKRKQIWLTPKLQALAELMPNNIWISKLSIKKSTQPARQGSSTANKDLSSSRQYLSLTLNGFALPGDNRGLRSIEDFAKQLKENPTFGRLIKQINLSTAARTKQNEVSALSFQLSCILSAEEAS